VHAQVLVGTVEGVFIAYLLGDLLALLAGGFLLRKYLAYCSVLRALSAALRTAKRWTNCCGCHFEGMCERKEVDILRKRVWCEMVMWETWASSLRLGWEFCDRGGHS
jgi:hypothetical protein